MGNVARWTAMETNPADQRQRMGLSTQLTRFVGVGVVSAVVDLGLLMILMAAGLTHTPAKALSFVAGTITAYSLNRIWTFQADHSTRRLAAVIVLYLLTFVLQVGIFAAIFPPLRDATSVLWAQVAGFVVAQGVATTVNFVVQRSVIFAR